MILPFITPTWAILLFAHLAYYARCVGSAGELRRGSLHALRGSAVLWGIGALVATGSLVSAGDAARATPLSFIAEGTTFLVLMVAVVYGLAWSLLSGGMLPYRILHHYAKPVLAPIAALLGFVGMLAFLWGWTAMGGDRTWAEWLMYAGLLLSALMPEVERRFPPITERMRNQMKRQQRR